METLCRACLLSNKTLILFDDASIFNYNLLTNISVDSSDGHPQNLCSDCLNIIQFYIEYREQCIANENMLKNKLVFKLNKEIEVKKEEENTLLEDVKEELFDTASHYDDFHQSDTELQPDPQTDENKNCTDETLNSTKRTKKAPKRYECETFKRKSIKKADKNIKSGNVKVKKVKKCYSNNSYLSKMNKFNCGLCKKVYKTRNSLVEHLEGHKANKICMICKKDDFTSWQALIAHRFNHIDDSEKYCHLCTRKFTLELTCLHHYTYFHRADALNDKMEISEYKCLVCHNNFESFLKLEKHVRTCHSEKCFMCDICGKVTNSKTTISAHVLVHYDIKPYKCKLCDEKFKLTQGLRTHMLRVHNGIKFMCKFCSRYFQTEEKLKKHKTKCKSNHECVCPACGKSIMQKMLRRHMRTHSDTVYQCPLCPTKVKTKAAFKNHSDRHAGTPAYKCEYCSRMFYNSSVLTKHKRIHTGEKPYVCVECGKAFTSNNNLKVHMKVHGLLLINKRPPKEDLK